jgi:hypothetical protein
VNEDQYCRELESYLCRKNDGHLIRIVGPAFEQVCGWAARGIPMKLAMRGIDRCFERYYAKGPRRRPVRIEFCEADVLDMFDEWKRSVGVAEPAEGAGRAGESGRESLPVHIERVIARLTVLRAGSDRTLDPLLDDVVRELDAVRGRAKGVRGDARDALIQQLRQLDASCVEALRTLADAATLAQLGAEADEELKPFRLRLPVEAYHEAHRACIARLLRDRVGLPVIAFD